MRRADREVTDAQKIDEIIRACNCCRLGFNDNGQVYIVPLSFGFEHEDGKRVFYFHGADTGRKVDLIQQGGEIGFELDTNYLLHAGERAYGFSVRFQSVIGNGIISAIDNDEEKIQALQSIMFQHTQKRDWDMSQKELDTAFVFKLEVTEIACKNHD